MKRGFTLIETLLYIGLYAIIIGGVATGVYSIVESNSHNQTKAMVQEEGAYLIGKVEWALMGPDLPPAQSPLVFTVDHGHLLLTRGLESPQILNNTNVSVSNWLVVNTTQNVQVSFTVSARAPNSIVYSEDFSTLRYLRK